MHMEQVYKQPNNENKQWLYPNDIVNSFMTEAERVNLGKKKSWKEKITKFSNEYLFLL